MNTTRTLSPKGAARRAQILEAAFQVLATEGYRRTSLREIARSLGVESAHILYYFASREELLVEVVQEWDRRTRESAMSGREADSELDIIDEWMAAVRENAKQHGLVHLYTTFSAEAADPGHDAHEYFLTRLDTLVEQLTEAIAARQSEGRVAARHDPRRVAMRLVALSDGLQLQWLANPDIDMAAELEEAIADLAPQAGAPLTS